MEVRVIIPRARVPMRVLLAQALATVRLRSIVHRSLGACSTVVPCGDIRLGSPRAPA